MAIPFRKDANDLSVLAVTPAFTPRYIAMNFLSHLMIIRRGWKRREDKVRTRVRDQCLSVIENRSS
jgi:hypothetical protein